MQKKPDDRFAVPLNAWCHRLGPNNQHDGEAQFWALRGMDPFAMAAWLYDQYGGDGGAPRRKKPRKPRPPPDKRKKIQSRPFPKRAKCQKNTRF